jgi:hypothetical protein
MTDKKIAFLVDFDNVATDVIEQALNAVFKDYGAAHIRRAYCNAEQALREQNFLKRLGLRAIVNLAIGKNSTDIALAADAMDLAITEKPDVIVLVSSDSDFAPLVLRLREKGAWLRGFGQYGKTGDGVIQIYDQFNELAHGTGRSSREAPPAKASSGRGGRRGRGGRALPEVPRGNGPQRPPRAEAVVTLPEPVVPEVVAPVVVAEPVAAPVPVDVATPAAKPAKAPRAAGKTARKTAAKPVAEAPAEAVAAPKAAAPAKAPKAAEKVPAAKASASDGDPQVAAAKEINAILALLPKLADGQWHELGAAAKVLKDAGLLAKNAPSTKLFRKHPKAFELQPDKTPNRVRFGHG